MAPRATAYSRPGSDRASTLDERALIAALRRGDRDALVEFFERSRPALLLTAGRLRVPPAEREGVVDDCLADAALRFMMSEAPAPQSLHAYLSRSLRNRVLNTARAQGRGDQRLLRAAGGGQGTEGVIAACCSEHALRASGGAAADELPPLSPALTRLVRALEQGMTEEEQLLATWVSHCVTQQEIAEWLGVGYKAASKRIERLRARLREAAMRYTAQLGGAERREVLAFLRRTALVPPPPPASREGKEGSAR